MLSNKAAGSWRIYFLNAQTHVYIKRDLSHQAARPRRAPLESTTGRPGRDPAPLATPRRLLAPGRGRTARTAAPRSHSSKHSSRHSALSVAVPLSFSLHFPRAQPAPSKRSAPSKCPAPSLEHEHGPRAPRAPAAARHSAAHARPEVKCSRKRSLKCQHTSLISHPAPSHRA